MKENPDNLSLKKVEEKLKKEFGVKIEEKAVILDVAKTSDESEPKVKRRPDKPVWAYEHDVDSDKYGFYADLVVKGVKQRFRWIESGEFLMGSPEDEEERAYSEILHRVRLTRGFWMADTTCTQALWQAVMENNPSYFKGDDLPVEEVTWNDTQDFIERLNDLTKGLNFRLPTEAEWEYACRAGTQAPFSFGEKVDSEQVNFNGNYPYANSKKSEYREKTVAVRSLPCNDWGLYEMHGNVWEWCEDWYDAEYETNDEIVIDPRGFDPDPRGLDPDITRVLRGGSWFYDASDCRSARRSCYEPVGRNRFNDMGFRLVSGHQEKTE